MSGKRTERTDMPKQLRFDFDLQQNIRVLAQLNRRPISLQLLHCIEIGVQSELDKLRQIQSVPVKAGQQESERRTA